MTFRWTPEAEAEFAQMWRDGVFIFVIKDHFRVSGDTIIKVRKRLGLLERISSGFWNADREAEAKRLYIDEGLSASETARRIGAHSRNQILGVANRRGWMVTGRKAACAPRRTNTIKAPTVARAAHPRPPKPGPQNKPGAIFGAYQHETDFAKAEIVRAKKTEAGLVKVANVSSGAGVESPNAVPMLDYVRGCKWPLGERGAVHYCCNPQVEGRVYCEGHRALSIARDQPQGVRDRDASRLTRFDRVEREPRRAAPVERSLWDDAREAA